MSGEQQPATGRCPPLPPWKHVVEPQGRLDIHVSLQISSAAIDLFGSPAEEARQLAMSGGHREDCPDDVRGLLRQSGLSLLI